MPATAAVFGIDSTSSPTEQIDAGIRYLRQLDAELPKEITDPEERIKFILASYNVGIAHIFDARRLAEKNGKDPNVWTENVDYYILNKSNPKYYQDEVVRYGYARGEETYNFVREILDRYGHYKNILEN
jgi:membrane-bound lytic murein transglycosylase F